MRVRKVLIASINENVTWAASEYYWRAFAEYALLQKTVVYISIFQKMSSAEAVENLGNMGARILIRSKLLSDGSLELVEQLQALHIDQIIFSQGDTYNFFSSTPLVEYLRSIETRPFIILCHAIRHFSTLTNKFIYARQIFLKAVLLGFDSDNNKNIVERHIGASLTNYKITDLPVNIADTSYCTFPHSEKIKFAMVSRLDCTSKGLDILLDVLSLPVWKKRNWELYIYGEGPDEIYLKALVKFYELGKRVIFKGFVQSVRTIWKENQLLIMPSIFEGTPVSLKEALILGRPAVVTDVGGMTELIRNNVNGYVAEAPNTKYLADAMERAWTSKNKWESMGIVGREMILRRENVLSPIEFYQTIQQMDD